MVMNQIPMDENTNMEISTDSEPATSESSQSQSQLSDVNIAEGSSGETKIIDKKVVDNDKVDVIFEEVSKSLGVQNMDLRSDAETGRPNELRPCIGRKELEEIILKKIIECLNLYQRSEIGELRSKFLNLQAGKDKLFRKVDFLERQVKELERALKIYKEIEAAKSESFISAKEERRRPPPVRFCRSVGLQVRINGSDPNASIRNNAEITLSEPDSTSSNWNGQYARKINSRIFNFNDAGTGPRKQMTMPVMPVHPLGTASPNSSTSPWKRVNKSNVAMDELRNHVGFGRLLPDPHSPKMARRQQQPNQAHLMNNIVHSFFNSVETGEQDVGSTVSGSVPGSGFVDIGGLAAPAAKAKIGRSESRSAEAQLIDLTEGENTGGGYQGKATGWGRSGTCFPRHNSSPIVIHTTAQEKQIHPIMKKTYGPAPSLNRYAGAMDKNMMASKNGNDVEPIKKPYLSLPPDNLAEKGFILPILPAANLVLQAHVTTTEFEPPIPLMTLKQQDGGIILTWDHQIGENFAAMSSYEIYCCQEPLNRTQTHTPNWKFVGNVGSMPLPMSCTLSSFRTGDKYHVILRGIDEYNRTGAFCEPESIFLENSF